MSEYTDAAVERHGQGHNCAQCVACAFADRVGVDEETLFKTFQAHGLGMGTMECTCGALTGAIGVVGLALSDGTPEAKRACYATAKRIVSRFAEEVGATRCRDIKGVDTGTVLTPCNECIRIGAKLAEEEIPW